MNKVVLIALLGLAGSLTGCGSRQIDRGSFYENTSAGAPLPSSHFTYCSMEYDEAGRCPLWHAHTDQCVNPKGHEASPPIVPCASIKKEHNDE